MIIIPKFQNSGKTPTRQQIEENKRKQEFLNQNGIKVKIDGSWGPWQQGWYNKIKAKQTEPKQNWFTRSTIGAAMAENPAIMTASGWQQDKQGDYVQKRTKESDQLADNLSVLSWTSPTHPGTAIIDAAITKGVFPLIKFTANKALKTAAKTGNNYARNKIINRELNQQIKNFDGTVSENYFNSPYNWYRITESPEVYGIKEMGKNVTTRDALDMYIPSNEYRASVIDLPVKRDNEGFLVLQKPQGMFSDSNFIPYGRAHGNTSQAAKGELWKMSTSGSGLFPKVILEGDMPVQTYRGFNPTTGLDSRSSFHLVDSETIPMGARIGFHTGEMPIEGLHSFTRLSNGRYRYDGPVIPYKTIQVNK